MYAFFLIVSITLAHLCVQVTPRCSMVAVLVWPYGIYERCIIILSFTLLYEGRNLG